MRLRLLPLAILALTTPAIADTTAPTAPATDAAAAQSVITEFSARLKGELKTAMTNGGPPAAIAVCQKRAPVITDELSASSGWQLRRVSLQPRKPANTPDEWERGILQQFAQQLAAGTDPKQVTHSEIVTTPTGQAQRFMRAIPTGEVCLACHGDNVSPDVAKALAAAYPDDQARGYRLGQLRGAFSLSKPLP